jgi:nucleoside-diphosphate-sugar epimerase
LKTLVLGGTRFLGPFVVNELLQRGHVVAVLSRSQGGEFEGPVARYLGDASEASCLQKTFAEWQPEGVIDLLHHNPEYATALVQASTGRIAHSVHLSCASVYGPQPMCPVDEETELMRPEAATVEVAAQIAADKLVLAAAAQELLPATVVRLPALYGPRDPRCAEWYFARRVLDGRKRIALPDGGLHICHRGFVQNMAWGIVQALSTAKSVGQVYNLGEEKLVTLAQLAQGVAKALDYQWDIYSVPGHLWSTPYNYTSFFDLRKARGHLRYRDRMIPRDGLELTLASLVQHPRGEDWSWPGLAAPFDYAREDDLIDRYGWR